MTASSSDIRQQILVARIPALPEILVKLIRLCQAEEAGMAEVSALIAQDAAMAAKIVGAAGSSLYACRGHKPGLKQALQTLGINATKTLLICESVFHVFNSLTKSGAVDLRHFWRHALMAAVSAQKIAVAMDYPYQEEAYLAGLLHDIGRLALLSVAPKEYAMLAAESDDAGLCAAEQQVLRITHAEAGSLLIGRWGFDSYLADSVLYHHESFARAAGTHPLIRLVILADAIASHGASQPASEVAAQLCGMSADEVTALCADSEEQVRQAALLLNLDLGEAAQQTADPCAATNASGSAQQQLALAVQERMLSLEAQQYLARQTDAAGVLSAIRQSAALLFGFRDVLVLLGDSDTGCLHGVADDSGRVDRSDFMMPQQDGGVVSASMAQRRVVILDSDTRLPRLSAEQQLQLQVRNGKVQPNARQGSAAAIDTQGAAKEAKLSLAEEQLLRLLDTEYLVCLPLSHGDQCRGVLLGAVLALQVDELHSRESFLMAFAGQAAAAIAEIDRKTLAEKHSEAHLAEEYRQAARRMIHEASSPLGIVKNYLAVLGHKAQRQEPVAAEVAILGEEIDRVGKILRGFADMRPASEGDGIEIDHIVGEVVNALSVLRAVPATVSLRTRLRAGATRLKGHGDELKQILHNLISNAADAQPGGGEVLISTDAGINRDGRLHCSLTVEDRGAGIPPDLLAKLFSPVPSSKGGSHMGLGLSIVHDLVSQLQGVITCRSSRDGTCFEVLLPIGDPKPRSPK